MLKKYTALISRGNMFVDILFIFALCYCFIQVSADDSVQKPSFDCVNNECETPSLTGNGDRNESSDEISGRNIDFNTSDIQTLQRFLIDGSSVHHIDDDIDDVYSSSSAPYSRQSVGGTNPNSRTWQNTFRNGFNVQNSPEENNRREVSSEGYNSPAARSNPKMWSNQNLVQTLIRNGYDGFSTQNFSGDSNIKELSDGNAGFLSTDARRNSPEDGRIEQERKFIALNHDEIPDATVLKYTIDANNKDRSSKQPQSGSVYNSVHVKPLPFYESRDASPKRLTKGNTNVAQKYYTGKHYYTPNQFGSTYGMPDPSEYKYTIVRNSEYTPQNVDNSYELTVPEDQNDIYPESYNSWYGTSQNPSYYQGIEPNVADHRFQPYEISNNITNNYVDTGHDENTLPDEISQIKPRAFTSHNSGYMPHFSNNLISHDSVDFPQYEFAEDHHVNDLYNTIPQQEYADHGLPDYANDFPGYDLVYRPATFTAYFEPPPKPDSYYQLMGLPNYYAANTHNYNPFYSPFMSAHGIQPQNTNDPLNQYVNNEIGDYYTNSNGMYEDASQPTIAEHFPRLPYNRKRPVQSTFDGILNRYGTSVRMPRIRTLKPEITSTVTSAPGFVSKVIYSPAINKPKYESYANRYPRIRYNRRSYDDPYIGVNKPSALTQARQTTKGDNIQYENSVSDQSNPLNQYQEKIQLNVPSTDRPVSYSSNVKLFKVSSPRTVQGPVDGNVSKNEQLRFPKKYEDHMTRYAVPLSDSSVIPRGPLRRSNAYERIINMLPYMFNRGLYLQKPAFGNSRSSHVIGETRTNPKTILNVGNEITKTDIGKSLRGMVNNVLHTLVGTLGGQYNDTNKARSSILTPKSLENSDVEWSVDDPAVVNDGNPKSTEDLENRFFKQQSEPLINVDPLSEPKYETQHCICTKKSFEPSNNEGIVYDFDQWDLGEPDEPYSDAVSTAIKNENSPGVYYPFEGAGPQLF